MDIVCNDNKLSTTQLLITGTPPVTADGVLCMDSQSKTPGYKGGLRTKGYFKGNFKKYLDNWYTCDSSGARVRCVDLPVDVAQCNVPLITVITVVYNCVMFVEETIRSVLRQNYPNVEYIIIDGGSTDGTLEIIQKYDYAVDYWISERDGGIYDAMNKGVELSTGKWLNILNVGDVLNGTGVFSQIDFNNKNIDIFYSDTILLKNNKYSIEKADLEKKRFVHQSFIYKKELHRSHGKYLCIPGVTISDYLFFSSIWNTRNSIRLQNPISIFRCGGVSSNDDHVYQRMAVDIMCGNSSAKIAALKILIFPFYRFLYTRLIAPYKSLIRR